MKFILIKTYSCKINVVEQKSKYFPLKSSQVEVQNRIKVKGKKCTHIYAHYLALPFHLFCTARSASSCNLLGGDASTLASQTKNVGYICCIMGML